MYAFIILVLLTALYFGWRQFRDMRVKYESLLEKYALLSESAQRLSNENMANWNRANELELEVKELEKELKNV